MHDEIGCEEYYTEDFDLRDIEEMRPTDLYPEDYRSSWNVIRRNVDERISAVRIHYERLVEMGDEDFDNDLRNNGYRRAIGLSDWQADFAIAD
jgi:hypothetical protein